jgi:folylpolyglutamate synthase/dihydropteroate synthase
VETDVVRAVELAAEEIRDEGGVVLVAGSLQTAAPALRWLRAR